jgi:ribosomal protein L37AE/L43A
MTDLSQAATTWTCPKCGAVVNSGDYHICYPRVPAPDVWERIAAALERIAAALEKQS